jgi:hypothetical protein
VTGRLKAGIVEQEDVAVDRQRFIKNVSAAMNEHTTIKELLEGACSVRSALRLCNEGQRDN